MTAGARISEEASRFSVSDEKFTLPAFAKINLSLRVLGRRPDNYHEIHTLFQTITLRDELTFESSCDDRIQLYCSEPDIPTDESNLVVRAALVLRERFEVGAGVRINLEKRVPVGGGLGGGSSDAAVTLMGLVRLWQLTASRDELAAIGSRLGADVPFFLAGGTALGTGTGTEITPLDDAPKMHLVVIAPGIKVLTTEAYKALNAPALTKESPPVMLPISLGEPDFSGFLREAMRNDFEPAVFPLYPEIARARAALLRAGASAAMLSGSGSSLFGVFDNREKAALARSELRAEAGWRVFACETLSRSEYERALGVRTLVG